MAISFRLSESEEQLIRDFAAIKGETISDLIRRTVLKTIENEVDWDIYHKTAAQYRKKASDPGERNPHYYGN